MRVVLVFQVQEKPIEETVRENVAKHNALNPAVPTQLHVLLQVVWATLVVIIFAKKDLQAACLQQVVINLAIALVDQRIQNTAPVTNYYHTYYYNE